MVDVRIISKYLTPNPYSRPTDKVNKIKGIVVHWTASPMGRNVGVWNYFERRKSGTNGYGSAHYIVDLDGTIWNCIPDTEMAWHVGSNTYTSEAKKRLSSYPNNCTLGIEFCVVDNKGKMNKATWREGAKLVAHLLDKHNLDIDDIWLHMDIVGWKDCHRYFVNNPSEYRKFKNDVANYLNGNVSTVTDSSSNDDFYTVKKGDTLWGIAQDFNITVSKLEKLNPNKNLYPLKIGEVLQVKEVSQTKYVIQRGDTLWGVSRKFNTTVDNLKKLNPTVNVYALQIGDTLVVEESLSSPKASNENQILPNKILKFGDKGEDVKKLQRALNKLYFNVGTVDGIFGRATQDALKRYQSMFFGLKNDGIFGTDTRKHMLNQLIN